MESDHENFNEYGIRSKMEQYEAYITGLKV